MISTPANSPNTANVVGLGLIGGSIALGLRQAGWAVHGEDVVVARAEEAVRRGVIDAAGLDPDAAVTFVAVPVVAAPDAVAHALKATSGVVTDVGSVKQPVCEVIDDDRFIGGHPMAGSELEGLDGADAAMFNGAIWVLTPRNGTSHDALTVVSRAVRLLGAEIAAMSPARHDEIVAVVSHVPHLTAASLMAMAADRGAEHAALLRLAAGGFRDMTRIASGHPDIWLDICEQNRPAILATLDRLIGGLSEMRAVVERDDRSGLRDRLERARTARQNLPERVARPEQLAEVRIPILDRPGAAAELFTTAADEHINIASFEVVHVAESNGGVAVVLVDADAASRYRDALVAGGFHPSVSPLT